MTAVSECQALPESWKEGVYEVIRRRRDIRAQFTPDPIPEAVLARILGAADSLDAMTSPRPYRRKLGESEARQILQSESGHRYDPNVIEALLAGDYDEVRLDQAS